MHRVFYAFELAALTILLLVAAWYAYTLPPIYLFYVDEFESVVNMPGELSLALYLLVPLIVLLLTYMAVILFRGFSRQSSSAHIEFWWTIVRIAVLAFAVDLFVCYSIRLAVESVVYISESTPQWKIDELESTYDYEWYHFCACTAPAEVMEKLK